LELYNTITRGGTENWNKAEKNACIDVGEFGSREVVIAFEMTAWFE
jgi:hypothetical protein